MEFVLEKIEALPENIHTDMKEFIAKLKEEPFDKNLLKDYGLSNGDVAERLQQLYLQQQDIPLQRGCTKEEKLRIWGKDIVWSDEWQ